MRAGAEALRAVELSRSDGRPLLESEREILGCDHAQVGRALLDQWNFPGAFREAVGFHHAPRHASKFPVEAAAVHLSEITAHALLWGRSGERRVPAFDPSAWDTLGLTASTFALLVGEAERQLEAAVHFMGAEA